MSGYRTHALIGAVGGLAAYRLVPALTEPFSLVVGSQTYVIPTAAFVWVSLGAIATLWPDIDESHTFPSYLLTHLAWIVGGGLGFLVAPGGELMQRIGISFLGASLGVIGVWIGLKGIRLLSGGHRKGTHSILTGLTLGISSILFFIHAVPVPGWICLVLTWGLILHLVGDVVTPGGVTLFYPISQREFHMLPHLVSRFGELEISLAAIFIGLILVVI